MVLPSHERPLFLVLPGPESIPDAFLALLAHDEVRAYALPAVWDLSWGPVDLMTLLPRVPRLDLECLPEAVEALLRAATPEALRSHVQGAWAEIPDSVRGFFLGRSALATLAAIFRLARPASSLPPPASFVSDRIHEARFEAAYRLHALPGAAPSPLAPPEEASLVFYPFDPGNAEGRAEAGLRPAGREAVLEAFAYEAGRARHRAFLEAVARERGWRAVDPGPS